jgi:spore maturation protein CgeB
VDFSSAARIFTEQLTFAAQHLFGCVQIVIFGLTLSSSWGNGHATPYRAILRALHRQGHSVTFYEENAPYYASRRDFSTCDYARLVLYEKWSDIRESALAEAAAADVVINASYCPAGAQIAAEVLALARPLHVFYDLDTPITLAQLTTSMCDYVRREQMPEFDLYLSFTGGEVLHELEQHWRVRRARPLYGCVDPDVHTRVAPRQEFQCALSYMGTYAADRQHKLDELFLSAARALPQERFVLAGSLYAGQEQWPANLRRFEHVASTEHAALYSSSRLTLNLTRNAMARTGYCPSGRFFEAAACGTPIVSDWFAGLDSFFTPAEEIFVARNSADVTTALRSDDAALQRMAERARARTLAEHTGEARARELLAYCDEAASRTARAA